LNLPPPLLTFIPPPPIPGIVSTGIIFAFKYLCTDYSYCIFDAITMGGKYFGTGVVAAIKVSLKI
jgi:hypothetical protein